MMVKNDRPLTKYGWPWHRQVNLNIYSGQNNWPKISIITPSFNQGKFIEETILSVLNQNYPNLEYIVIDGGSTDNSVDVIKKYQDKLTFWVSEKDKGQAHAINKGLEHCSGKIFNWINSDDVLAENALFEVATAYLKAPSAKIIAGGCAVINDFVLEDYRYNKQNLTFTGLITEKSNFQQPSQWICLTSNNIRVNEQHHYAFDWEMVLKLRAKETEITYIDKLLSYFRIHSASKTSNHSIDFQKEKLAIIKIYIREHGRSWTLFKYCLLLDAYLYTDKAKKDGTKLLPILIKKPLYIFSRFYMSNLIKSLLN
jgi:glycosyltransferase involved in cell wall biosynthesis